MSPRQSSDDPFRPFRSRRGRVVALVLGSLSVLVFVGLGLLLPAQGGLTEWHAPDRVLVASMGLAIGGLCWRYATIRAVPTREGLLVRNLFTTRRLDWPQVLRVQYGSGAPWVTLDLDDTDTLAVMAIQRADGAAANVEASRLAALVQALGEAREKR